MLKLSQTTPWRLFVRNLYFSVKSAEKFSSIASAINFKFLHIFYSFLSFSKFKK